MRAALALARRGLGRVWPNPAVGCVIVSDNCIVGRGWTQPGGRPHAETEALRAAGPRAEGATVYVTLEPCCHHGRTPPCADALIAAKVSRVVSAMEDPDARVSGMGHARLRAAGVAVHCGVGDAAARRLNEGYLKKLLEYRPLVTLKIASTLDGRIALGNGASQWITGSEARARGHLLRASHDAILVGRGTALADDPSLTCRLSGLEDRSPVRVVLDSQMRLPLDGQLAATARQNPVWVITGKQSGPAERREALTALGVEILRVDGDAAGRPGIEATLKALAARGVTRLLVEGGGEVLSAFLRCNVVDRLVWFRAGSVIGGDGLAAVAPMGFDDLGQLQRFRRESITPVGADVMETFVLAPETDVSG
jgi:diaminohydroxyphosphoribosylaminopyrimidine deaminase / 5-amino-6-(5-phosphoribosylamino)uracil reductase